MKYLLVLIVALGCAVSGAAQGNLSAGDSSQEIACVRGRTPFCWDQRTASELDYHKRLNNTIGLTTDERQSLIAAVAAQLKKSRVADPEMFGDLSDADIRRLAPVTNVQLADLNGGASRTFILKSYGAKLCGAVGNCLIWIYEMTPQGPRPLLESGGQVITVRDDSTNGYRDIVIGTHNSASERTLLHYQYASGRYRRVGCYEASWTLMTKTEWKVLNIPRITACRPLPKKR
jgi:hypothetical protein